MKYYDNFTIDEINLFNYNDVIPLTKEEVLSLLLWSNQTLI